MCERVDVAPLSPLDDLLQELAAPRRAPPHRFGLPDVAKDVEHREDPEVEIAAYPGHRVGVGDPVALPGVGLQTPVSEEGPPPAPGAPRRTVGLPAGRNRRIRALPGGRPGLAVGHAAELSDGPGSLSGRGGLRVPPPGRKQLSKAFRPRAHRRRRLAAAFRVIARPEEKIRRERVLQGRGVQVTVTGGPEHVELSDRIGLLLPPPGLARRPREPEIVAVEPVAVAVDRGRPPGELRVGWNGGAPVHRPEGDRRGGAGGRHPADVLPVGVHEGLVAHDGGGPRVHQAEVMGGPASRAVDPDRHARPVGFPVRAAGVPQGLQDEREPPGRHGDRREGLPARREVGVVQNGRQNEQGHPVVVGQPAGEGEGRVVLLPQRHRREVQNEGRGGSAFGFAIGGIVVVVVVASGLSRRRHHRRRRR
mmetsp:Transcript_1791/g.4658  ORF Transcript_1791/g.4658 Transcript_1791/m.4658 type:complete len:420 (+) Transcript_1791:1382-2641(+)